MTDTATVETLTAEVRCLVIGNRQVTLSMAKQLDWVDSSRIDPMGRIQAPGVRSATLVYVIGRDRQTGSLVLSVAQGNERMPDYQTFKAWKDLPLIILAGAR